MKLFLRFLLVAGLLVVALFLTSKFFVRRWGRDVDSLQVSSGAYRFTAKRNDVGVWKIDAPDADSLWFAMGYVQTQDREFQVELKRHMVLGRLASWFGPTQLKRDRLMRFIAQISWERWQRLPENSLTRRASEAFVAGHAEAVNADPTRVPVEYRLFKLDRWKFPKWEPWQVAAMARLDAWEFSYDLRNDLRSESVSRTLGDEWARWLIPPEPAEGAGSVGLGPNEGKSRPVTTLYGERDVAPGVKTFPFPKDFSPRGLAPWLPERIYRPQDEFSSPGAPATPAPPGQKSAALETLVGAGRGASNLWIVSNPRTGQPPTLCNDAHVGFFWPSVLYPIEYRVAQNEAHGQGFQLPGNPAMLIGKVDHPERSFAWGLTMANFADTQDLVALTPKSLNDAKKFSQTFEIRDPVSFESHTESFGEEWTPFGPRVDGMLEWKRARPDEAVALDWAGFRDADGPLDFFLRRNLEGAADLRRELATEWVFPAVNFTWMERQGAGAPSFGHVVPGVLFDRPRHPPARILSEAQARARRLSFVRDRPYFERTAPAEDPFLLVTGNQRVYVGALADRVAWEWTDGSRVRRLLETEAKLFARPESGQTDYVSLTLKEFLLKARVRVSVDRLCAEQGGPAFEACQELVTGLDRWTGETDAQRWEPTLAALWHQQAKLALWPRRPDGKEAGEDLEAIVKDWVNSNASNRALDAALSDDSRRLVWEKLSRAELAERLATAFRRSLDVLERDLGPHSAAWSWGAVHQIDWIHPVGLLPDPLGPWLKDSLLGPPPGVPGALDTPGRFTYEWDPAQPTRFPSRHGAGMRICTEFPNVKGEGGPMPPSETRWSLSTGVSGNPLSPWAWTFARDHFFRDHLAP
jgi:acyl-homoserine lactone acylase PvdQ